MLAGLFLIYFAFLVGCSYSVFERFIKALRWRNELVDKEKFDLELRVSDFNQIKSQLWWWFWAVTICCIIAVLFIIFSYTSPFGHFDITGMGVIQISTVLSYNAVIYFIVRVSLGIERKRHQV